MMEPTSFDYYIDRAVNGEYLAQTKRLLIIPEKIEENIFYYSKAKEEKIIDENWIKLLYYANISYAMLLDLSYRIETQCKFYDPNLYGKAKKKSAMEADLGDIANNFFYFVRDVVIPVGTAVVDRQFQEKVDTSIDTMDLWIKIWKKFKNSDTMKVFQAQVEKSKEMLKSFDKYQMKVDLSSPDDIEKVLTTVKFMRNKLISSRRIIYYYLTLSDSKLTEEQKLEIEKVFHRYLKKEKDIIQNFFDISMKFHK